MEVSVLEALLVGTLPAALAMLGSIANLVISMRGKKMKQLEKIQQEINKLVKDLDKLRKQLDKTNQKVQKML